MMHWIEMMFVQLDLFGFSLNRDINATTATYIHSALVTTNTYVVIYMDVGGEDEWSFL